MKSDESISGRSVSSAAKPTHEQISSRAEVLWEARGRPAGQDETIWLEAERQLYDENKEIFSGTETEAAPSSRSSSETMSGGSSSPNTRPELPAKESSSKKSSSRVKKGR